MPPVQTQAEGASLVVAGLVLAVAAVLAWRERRDRGLRDPDLSPEDARHFRNQDRRRMVGVVVMAVLAAGVVFGSRLAPQVAGRTNRVFVFTWLVLFVLILGLLLLALLDWIALRIYVGRVRRVLGRERVEILTEEIRRRRSAGANGHGQGSFDDLL